jgi:Tfp pilus assembly protein PilX
MRVFSLRLVRRPATPRRGVALPAVLALLAALGVLTAGSYAAADQHGRAAAAAPRAMSVAEYGLHYEMAASRP